METRRRFLCDILGRGLIASLVVGLAVASSPIQTLAAPIDYAKAAGWVGERPDGFVGLVRGDAPAAVRSLVDQINAQRRARYTDIAGRNSTSPGQVGALAGQKLISATPPGPYVMTKGGQGVTK